MLSLKDILYMRVFLADGRLIVDTDQEGNYPTGAAEDGLLQAGLESQEPQVSYGGDILEVTAPILMDDEVFGGVQVAFSTASIEAEIGRLTWRRVLLALILMSVGTLLSFGVARYYTRPLVRLVRATQEVAEGRFDGVAADERRDEIGDLSRAFTDMTHRLRESRKGLEERARDLWNTNDLLKMEVSERISAEQALKTSSAELQRGNRELEQFATIAAHDLQEPLRRMGSFGDRLQVECSDGLTVEGRGFVQEMRDAAATMGTLVDDLLEYSRLTTRFDQYEEVDLSQLAREAVSDLQARIEQVGGVVELSDLPRIEADPTQMRQLLQNLIGNGLKFHRPEVRPVVKVWGQVGSGKRRGLTNGRGPRGICRITVEDNGIGFDEKYVDRIFVVFQRVHGSSNYGGAGVGLAICRKIGERHGGTITARSSPGRGSTFVVALPIKQPPAGQTPQAAGPHRREEGAALE